MADMTSCFACASGNPVTDLITKLSPTDELRLIRVGAETQAQSFSVLTLETIGVFHLYNWRHRVGLLIIILRGWAG